MLLKKDIRNVMQNFNDHIGSKTSECIKDGHCFWMDESRDNDKLEVRLPMWDHPLLLECESIKAAFTNLMEKKMEKTLRVFIVITNIWFVSIAENMS